MKKLAVGIVIGKTNTVVGFVDQTGDIYAESSIRTYEYCFDDYPLYIADLCEVLHSLARQIPFECWLVGIGVSAPNANHYTGTIENPVDLWRFSGKERNRDECCRHFRLAEDISRYFNGTKVLITNSANAAVVSEMVFGNARGMKDFVMISLGARLYSGFVANGELIYGHDGMAGELGHVVVERENGRMCNCGVNGHLEAYVSTRGVVRTVFELMAKTNTSSKLRDVVFNDMEWKVIFAAAEQGDPIALETFRYTGELLGRVLASVAAVTSPKAIFLSGELAKAGRMLFEPTKKYMEESLFAAYKNKIELLPSGIGCVNAAILGAAALIWQEV